MNSAAISKAGQRLRRIWADDASLRTRLTNIGHLMSGNAAGTVMGLLAMLVTARALGPTEYGVLALTYAYVRTVGKVVGVQSWQPLIKYGAELRTEHVDDYRALLKYGFVVDILAALASFCVAVGFAIFLGPLFGLSQEAIRYVLIFSVVLLCDLAGVPTAVMRLAGRFRMVAYGAAANGVLRTVLCALGLIMGADLLYFIAIWAMTQILGSLLLLFFTFRELHRQGIKGIARTSLRGVRARFEGLVGFTLAGKAEMTVRSSANEFDTLIVGAFGDPASAGLYHIAKRLARVVLQMGVQVQAVLYPDVARLWAVRAVGEFRRTVGQMEVLLAMFGVACLVATIIAIGPFLTLTVGPEFAGAASLAIVQMFAVVLQLSGSAVRTAMLAMGRQPTVLKIVLISTIAFHITAFTLIPQYGPVGANIAHVVMALIWVAGVTIAFRSALKSASPGPR
jgi:O-antigen/teichoic acid export membrane protein